MSQLVDHAAPPRWPEVFSNMILTPRILVYERTYVDHIIWVKQNFPVSSSCLFFCAKLPVNKISPLFPWLKLYENLQRIFTSYIGYILVSFFALEKFWTLSLLKCCRKSSLLYFLLRYCANHNPNQQITTVLGIRHLLSI